MYSNRKALDVVFSLIAVQEAVFFLKIAENFKNSGLKIGFISFHQGASQHIKKTSYPLFCIHEILKKDPQLKTADLDSIRGKYKNVAVENIYRHESLTTHRFNQEKLQKKVLTYFFIFDQILKRHSIGCIVQELGGFIAPQALFHVSQKHNVKHVFIEPSMFPKHVVFTLNNLYAKLNRKKLRQTNEKDICFIQKYQSMYNTERPVVIPYKDRYFFKGARFSAIFNLVNFKKLFRKLIHKYVLNYTEEYNAIFYYVWGYLKRSIVYKYNSFFYYSSPSRHPRLQSGTPKKYVYFPLHVPLDVQLTVRTPEYLDQISLCEKIAECLPEGYELLIKEHPASIGAYAFVPLKKLTRAGKIKIIHPSYNSYELIKKASCIITINSKVGIESVMQQKNVIVLGQAFYREHGVTYDVTGLDAMKSVLKEVLGEKGASQLDERKIQTFLVDAYKWAYPGDLYDLKPENVKTFTKSLHSYYEVATHIN